MQTTSLPGEYASVLACYLNTARTRRATTIEDYTRVLGEFARFCRALPLHEIRRRDVLNFRDALLERGQSPTTASRKVGILKTLFGHALDYELMEHNPAERVRNLPASTRKARVAFSGEDLHRIFHSPIYTAGLRPLGGGVEAAFWLPLLALFTGARVEELAQLTTADLIHAPGLGHYLNISDEAEHAKLKNASSRRRIPLHATLIACGFLTYVAKRPTGAFLFPDLRCNPRGRRAGYFSNFFSGHLRRSVGITDRRKVFHSFRHTFKDLCRHTGIDEAVHDALTGHTASGAGRRYGNEFYPLPPLFKAIARYAPPVDLSHLTATPRPAETPRPDEPHIVLPKRPATHAHLCPVGKARGVLIPAALLAQSGITDEVELRVEGERIIIQNRHMPRTGRYGREAITRSKNTRPKR